MRFTVPFLLAIAVYVATVLGANQTSFTPNEDMLYDVVSASDAIAYRLERALGLSEQLALMIGALLLAIPALLTFHLFRVGFGGSVQSLIQEDRLSRQLAREREQAQAARYVTAQSALSERAQDGEVLTRSRAGDRAQAAGSSADEVRIDRRDGKDRRRGLGSNIAAALKGRSRSRSQSADGATSGTTSLSANGDESRPLKERWSGILDTKPDFSRLKSGAQNLREKITPRSGSTKLSIDDLADDK